MAVVHVQDLSKFNSLKSHIPKKLKEDGIQLFMYCNIDKRWTLNCYHSSHKHFPIAFFYLSVVVISTTSPEIPNLVDSGCFNIADPNALVAQTNSQYLIAIRSGFNIEIWQSCSYWILESTITLDYRQQEYPSSSFLQFDSFLSGSYKLEYLLMIYALTIRFGF